VIELAYNLLWSLTQHDEREENHNFGCESKKSHHDMESSNFLQAGWKADKEPNNFGSKDQ